MSLVLQGAIIMDSRRLKEIIRNSIFKPIVRVLFRIFPPFWLSICKQAYYLKAWPNLKNPQRYNEKLLLYMDSELMESYYIYADKITVRDYVEKAVGSKYLAKLYAVYNKYEEIDLDNLPDKFYLKFNHGCGGHLPCFNKETFTKEIIYKRAYINKKLAEDYSEVFGERQYHKIKAKLFVEEMLEFDFPKGALYRLYTFSGKVNFIKVTGTLSNGQIVSNHYDCQWNEIDKSFGYKREFCYFQKPNNLEEMIEVAEKLAATFPFVRVDLYSFKDRIVFSELTFTPAAASAPIFPKEWDYELGKLFPYPFD